MLSHFHLRHLAALAALLSLSHGEEYTSGLIYGDPLLQVAHLRKVTLPGLAAVPSVDNNEAMSATSFLDEHALLEFLMDIGMFSVFGTNSDSGTPPQMIQYSAWLDRCLTATSSTSHC
jgi:hypothetical protein